MPSRSPRPCAQPGCNVLVASGSRCAIHARAVRREYRPKEVQDLYNSKRWKAMRRRVLMDTPWCADCLREGKRVVATDVHHVRPHLGDAIRFWDGPFEALCHAHHSKKTADEINGRVR